MNPKLPLRSEDLCGDILEIALNETTPFTPELLHCCSYKEQVMGDSTDSVSIDIDMMPLGGKECLVKTSKGSITVLVCGDQEKPALITYPDVALNYMSCFQGLFFSPDSASLLLHNFCIYHIDAPGHEFVQLGAAVIPSDVPLLSVDDLADQVAEVVDFFGLQTDPYSAWWLTLISNDTSHWVELAIENRLTRDGAQKAYIHLVKPNVSVRNRKQLPLRCLKSNA
ncbi:hypothetical protein TEA_016833 [Camellia sinensis var. sinensis]|uniref:Uncharacterized protein n=1 Tax=Camellia sinensis var. sinensis TaxID=542762 RepID=A0A4S4DFP9_CAMSN|nr:hypothetical protein TEA_016833 [Camellia sinensis var. sinensis]